MTPTDIDVLRRLAAADPAGTFALGETVRAQTWERISAAITQEPTTPQATTTAPRRPRARRRALFLFVPALLALGGVALAATGVIRIGAPARPTTELSAPHRDFGVLTPGTVRLLAVRTPDPVGGPDWGLRVLSTSRGFGCIQTGRLVDGQLGALGQDGAFGDDGAFHALPVSAAFSPVGCTALDAHGRIFLTVTAADAIANGWGRGCQPPIQLAPALLARTPKGELCPLGAQRVLYYGLLGPDATSITYTSNGRSVTQPTVGPEGAYLIVTRPPAAPSFPGPGATGLLPIDSPLTTISYRHAETCHLPGPGRYATCVPPGYAPVQVSTVTRAEAVTPVHVQVGRARNGHPDLIVSFRSRVAVDGAQRAYDVTAQQPGSPLGFGQLTRQDIAPGQLVTVQIADGGPSLRRGTVTGTVQLLEESRPSSDGFPLDGNLSVHVLIAAFSTKIP